MPALATKDCECCQKPVLPVRVTQALQVQRRNVSSQKISLVTHMPNGGQGCRVRHREEKCIIISKCMTKQRSVWCMPWYNPLTLCSVRAHDSTILLHWVQSGLMTLQFSYTVFGQGSKFYDPASHTCSVRAQDSTISSYTMFSQGSRHAPNTYLCLNNKALSICPLLSSGNWSVITNCSTIWSAMAGRSAASMSNSMAPAAKQWPQQCTLCSKHHQRLLLLQNDNWRNSCNRLSSGGPSAHGTSVLQKFICFPKWKWDSNTFLCITMGCLDVQSPCIKTEDNSQAKVKKVADGQSTD